MLGDGIIAESESMKALSQVLGQMAASDAERERLAAEANFAKRWIDGKEGFLNSLINNKGRRHRIAERIGHNPGYWNVYWRVTDPLDLIINQAPITATLRGNHHPRSGYGLFDEMLIRARFTEDVIDRNIFTIEHWSIRSWSGQPTPGQLEMANDILALVDLNLPDLSAKDKRALIDHSPEFPIQTQERFHTD